LDDWGFLWHAPLYQPQAFITLFSAWPTSVYGVIVVAEAAVFADGAGQAVELVIIKGL
jgi:hypothetical protein